MSYHTQQVVVAVILILVSISICSASARQVEVDLYEEEAYFRRVASGSGTTTTIANFQFTTRWMQTLPKAEAESGSISVFKWKHFNLFPKAFGQVMDRFNIHELHLTFSKGEWNQKAWGYPFVPAPSGMELIALLEDDSIPSEYGTDDAWTRATRELAGMFCASINQLDSEHATSPVQTFFGENNFGGNKTLSLRYGQLPNEVSCTENLTPWLKLDTCRSEAGLATLLVPKEIYSARHHTMGTHFRRVCYDNYANSEGNTSEVKDQWSGCRRRVAELVQTLTVVIDHDSKIGSLKSLLGSHTANNITIPPCEVAYTSMAYVETGLDTVSDTKQKIEKVANAFGQATTNVLSYDLNEYAGLNENMLTGAGSTLSSDNLVTPPISIQRSTTGSGQLYGGISTTISNDDNFQIGLRVLEVIPAYIRIRPSTLEIKSNGVLWNRADVLEAVKFDLPRLDESSGTMEFKFNIPANMTITLHYQYEKLFQAIAKFPPDANRGFDIPAVAVFYETGSGVETTVSSYASPLLSRLLFQPGMKMRVYSNLLLTMMPLPDFSMPFNVITLSSTVIALFFGSTMNHLSRRRSKEKPTPLKERIKNKLMLLKDILFGDKQ